jgi:hypothetical protein
MEIEWRGHMHIQRLDYWGIPFHCSGCKEVGHLKKDCVGRSKQQYVVDSAGGFSSFCGLVLRKKRVFI